MKKVSIFILVLIISVFPASFVLYLCKDYVKMKYFNIKPDDGVKQDMKQKKDIKIIATLGKESYAQIPEFCKSGANIFRINGSHIKSKEQLEEMLKNVKAVMVNVPECQNVELMYDTQGPEIRTRIVSTNQQENVGYKIKVNDKIVVHTNLEDSEIVFIGDKERSENEIKTIHIGVNYKEFINDVKANDLITIESREIYAQVEDVNFNNGTITLNITEINTENDEYVLTDRRHINLLGSNVSQPTLTEMDKEYIKMSALAGVKYYAISFVRNAKDIDDVRAIMLEALSPDAQQGDSNSDKINDMKVIAKIETKQGLDNIDEILQVADGVMVARGDLASEIPVIEVPYAKAKIIKTSNKYNKFSIMATDVLESITRQNIPSRNDLDVIATSLQLGTDAIMLSNETAQGTRGVKAINIVKENIDYYLSHE